MRLRDFERRPGSGPRDCHLQPIAHAGYPAGSSCLLSYPCGERARTAKLPAVLPAGETCALLLSLDTLRSNSRHGKTASAPDRIGAAILPNSGAICSHQSWAILVTLVVKFRHRCSCASTSTSTEADVSLTSLQADLEAAVSAEDYQRAANLRDELT